MLSKPIDILIGTPGRIIDYSSSRHLNLSQTEVLVLDEADRMLDMGFIPDVRRIINKLPGKDVRQTLLYSATLEDKISCALPMPGSKTRYRWKVKPINW